MTTLAASDLTPDDEVLAERLVTTLAAQDMDVWLAAFAAVPGVRWFCQFEAVPDSHGW
jgi:hypothetical protein